MPVVPATREAEAGELLEPRRWRLRRAKIVPLHSSLGNNSETPSQKKKKKRNLSSVLDKLNVVVIFISPLPSPKDTGIMPRDWETVQQSISLKKSYTATKCLPGVI